MQNPTRLIWIDIENTRPFQNLIIKDPQGRTLKNHILTDTLKQRFISTWNILAFWTLGEKKDFRDYHILTRGLFFWPMMILTGFFIPYLISASILSFKQPQKYSAAYNTAILLGAISQLPTLLLATITTALLTPFILSVHLAVMAYNSLKPSGPDGGGPGPNTPPKPSQWFKFNRFKPKDNSNKHKKEAIKESTSGKFFSDCFGRKKKKIVGLTTFDSSKEETKDTETRSQITYAQ